VLGGPEDTSKVGFTLCYVTQEWVRDPALQTNFYKKRDPYGNGMKLGLPHVLKESTKVRVSLS
jgi:hypothetical protein